MEPAFKIMAAYTDTHAGATYDMQSPVSASALIPSTVIVIAILLFICLLLYSPLLSPSWLVSFPRFNRQLSSYSLIPSWTAMRSQVSTQHISLVRCLLRCVFSAQPLTRLLALISSALSSASFEISLLSLFSSSKKVLLASFPSLSSNFFHLSL